MEMVVSRVSGLKVSVCVDERKVLQGASVVVLSEKEARYVGGKERHVSGAEVDNVYKQH
jgi:hypothetical protein